MAKEFSYRGKKMEELLKMSLKEISALLPARERRSITKGFSEEEKTILKKIRDGETPETHSREMIILPEMVGKNIKIYNGKIFAQLTITNEMIGHRLGEFALTRKKVSHHAPGIGATRSSASLSVK